MNLDETSEESNWSDSSSTSVYETESSFEDDCDSCEEDSREDDFKDVMRRMNIIEQDLKYFKLENETFKQQLYHNSKTLHLIMIPIITILILIFLCMCYC